MFGISISVWGGTAVFSKVYDGLSVYGCLGLMLNWGSEKLCSGAQWDGWGSEGGWQWLLVFGFGQFHQGRKAGHGWGWRWKYRNVVLFLLDSLLLLGQSHPSAWKPRWSWSKRNLCRRLLNKGLKLSHLLLGF